KEESAKPEQPSKEESAQVEISSKEEKEEDLKVLDQGLEKTKEGFFNRIGKALVGRSTVDVSFLDDLEEALVSADVGVQTTVKIIKRLEERVARDKYINTSELNKIMREEVIGLLSENNQDIENAFKLPANQGDPYVIMVVG